MGFEPVPGSSQKSKISENLQSFARQVIRARGCCTGGFAPCAFSPATIISNHFSHFFMKKAVLLLLLIFLAACATPEATTQPEPVKEPTPAKVIEEKVVVQCWDNSTADSIENCPPRPETQEVVEPEQETVTENIPIGKKLLAEAESSFDSYAYLLADRMVIVHNNKARHYFFKMSMLEDRTPITDVYVDLNTQTARAYCNIEREGQILDNSFEYERSKCKGYINEELPVDYTKWLPKGPLQYLEQYADKEPILVENNVQTINIGGNSKTIQPSLHYMEGGKRVVLRIDRRYNVPVKIEIEGQQSIDFRDTFFDVMVLEGKQEKIGRSWVEYQPVSDYWGE